MSFQNGARSKNADKKLGRERRRVVLKSRDFKKRERGGLENVRTDSGAGASTAF